MHYVMLSRYMSSASTVVTAFHLINHGNMAKFEVLDFIYIIKYKYMYIYSNVLISYIERIRKYQFFCLKSFIVQNLTKMGTRLKILHKISISELIILKSFIIQNLTKMGTRLKILHKPEPSPWICQWL